MPDLDQQNGLANQRSAYLYFMKVLRRDTLDSYGGVWGEKDAAALATALACMATNCRTSDN